MSFSAARIRRAGAAALVLASAVLVAGCSEPVDYKQALQVADVTAGWYDGGIKDGKNRLVPTVSFRVKKADGVDIGAVSLNVIFRKLDPTKKEIEDLDEVFYQNVEFSEGSQTALLRARATNGYTGDPPQTRAEMLANSQFQDARAIVFVKQSSTTWVELLRQDLPRVLINK